MNAATATQRWLVLVSARKTEVRTYPRKNRHAAAADQPLWKICQAESKAKVRELSFYAFFFVLAAIGTASAFAVLNEMTSTGSLTYFVQHALR
jgi:hypothetical protein